jgi:rubrerythrin
MEFSSWIKEFIENLFDGFHFQSEEDQNVQSNKKFIIDPCINERNSCFTVDKISAPKICPICRTNSHISYLANNGWICEECGFIWK